MTKDPGSTIVTAILALLCMPVFIALAAAWDGYVLSILWRWFVVAQFGLRELSLPMAIGIGLVSSSLTHQFPPDVEEKERSLGERFGLAALKLFTRPLFLLAVGSIVKSYVQ